MNSTFQPCHQRAFIVLISLVGSLLFITPASGALRTWDNGAGDNNWFNPTNWDGDATIPAAGDDVSIGSVGAGVTLTNQTAYLASLTIGTNTLTFSDTTNLVAVLRATNIIVQNLGTIEHAAISITTTNQAGEWLADQRVYIVCSNISVETGGKIDVDEKGYIGDDGPGAGSVGSGGWYGGGGYGGDGGRGNSVVSSEGAAYGAITGPMQPGSGGGKSNGGPGGGWIRIEADGRVTVDGTITANGRNGNAGNGNGAGSGGGIYISCQTFAGSNGVVSADGGVQGYLLAGGGGGGGRIAVLYDASAQSNLVVKPAFMTFSANQGPEGGAEPGTIYFPDNTLLSPTKIQGGQIIVPGFESWSVGDFTLSGGHLIFTNTFSLTISNDFTISGRGEVAFTNDLIMGGLLNINGGDLTVWGGLAISNTDLTIAGILNLYLTNDQFNIPGDLTINAGGDMQMLRFGDMSPDLTVGSNLLVDSGTFTYYGRLTNGAALTVSGNATVTNGGDWYIMSGMTNGTTTTNGVVVDISGDLTITENAWIWPVSHRVNGGSPIFRVDNLTIPDANGGFNANNGGFGALKPTGYGPGGGTCPGGGWAGGGGHGGAGADGSTGVGGGTNGSAEMPVLAGSGAGRTDNFGGGVIRLEIASKFTLSGSLLADGIDFAAGDGSGGGGGAGGSIYVRCVRLAGANAVLSAEGGNARTSSSGGGGGGGRIAIHRLPVLETAATNTWSISVDGGTAFANGDTGTIYWAAITYPVPPEITNQRPANVTVTFADLVGNVVSTGTRPASVWAFWGENDGGTDLATSTWQNTNGFPGTRDVGPISTNVPVVVDKTYYYRFYATNVAGAVWASPVEIFTTGDVTMEATDANADEDGLDPGVFQISRPAWATNGPVTIYYAMSGDASNGLDYAALSGSASMAPGESNTTVTITPLADGIVTEGVETVVMTLIGDGYVIGSMNVATVNIADASVDAINTNIAAGVWSNAAIWSSGHKPVDGQSVIVTNDVIISEPSANIVTLTVTNATLTFTNWLTRLKAVEIFIRSGSTLTLPAAFSDSGPSNRVWLAASNITIDAGALINVNKLGFLRQQGPGAGVYDLGSGYGGGGGHGGPGGAGNPVSNTGGPRNGSAAAPLSPGSGGGGYKSGRADAGNGGGAVLLEADNRVTFDGTITANGENGTGGIGGSAGSGGGVYITCREFASHNGLISANGGNSSTYGGSAGGRIAINYNLAAQASLNLSDKPVIKMVAKNGGPSLRPGRPGTIYTPDSGFFPGTNLYGGEVMVPGLTVWNTPNIVASDGMAVLHDFAVHVSNDLRVISGGELEISNVTVTVGGDLIVNGGDLWFIGSQTNLVALEVAGNILVTNSADFHVVAGITNDLRTNGVLISTAGEMIVAPGCWVHPYSRRVNGGSPIFRVLDLTIIDATCGFDADETGFGSLKPQGYGPGGGTCPAGGWAGGGGYGGKGADGSTGVGGAIYGMEETPIHAGSGAGRTDNFGGGLVRVEASRRMTLNGVITANGRSYPAADGSGAGGGAGGGIYLTCQVLAGTNATLSANGGDARTASWGGGGGGGRIAIWRVLEFQEADTNTWTVTASGGNAFTVGDVGTVYWGESPGPPKGTVFLIR